MNDNYKIAVLYAHKLTKGEYHIDIVHDAYLNYYRYYGKNLFEQNINVCKVIIRRRWQELHRYKTYILNGEHYARRFPEFKEYHKFSQVTPLDILIKREVEESINRLPEFSRYAVTKRGEGYSLNEIADQLGVNQSTVLRHIQKYKKQLTN